MPTIRDITMVAVAHVMQPHQAFGTSLGLNSTRGASLILLTTDDGVEGVGEAWGPPGMTRAALEFVKPRFIGTSLGAQRSVAESLLAFAYHIRGALKAVLGGIDIAAHDALGKLLGVSVADLLGGRQRDRLAVYASSGFFTAEDDQEAALAAQVEPLHGSAFAAVKIRIGRRPDEDQQRVRLTRRLVGEGKPIAVDANCTYTADTALASMHRIAPFGVLWYEEPLAPEDWGGYAELARHGLIPIAAGEPLNSVADFRRLVNGRLAAVLQPDLTVCGGFATARVVGAFAAAEHLSLSPHCCTTGVGLAAAAQWMASLPEQPALFEYDIGPNVLRDALLATPLKVSDGVLEVPAGPGLGIALDPAALKHFAVA
jgi:D-galactarolactone cycloisomerase